MLAASAVEGHFCVGCIGTYLIVAAYAAIALLGWRSAGFPEAGRGAVLAGGGAAVAFALLLYPGLHTPKTSAESGREALAAVAGAATSGAPAAAPAGEAPAP